MSDKGIDPLPTFKKSISITRKKYKMLKFFGLAPEKTLYSSKNKVQYHYYAAKNNNQILNFGKNPTVQ